MLILFGTPDGWFGGLVPGGPADPEEPGVCLVFRELLHIRNFSGILTTNV